MANILVTGCAGFIGSNISEALLKEGHNVIGIDNLDPYYSVEIKKANLEILKKFSSFEFMFGSILDDSALQKIKAKGVEIVNHQAAMAGVRASMKNPQKYCNVNVLGTVRLLDVFRDVEKFVCASSSSVYGEVKEEDLPVSETRSPSPISPYALSKLQGEQWCGMFSESYGMKTVMLRYFTVYGPRQRPDEAIQKFINKIFKGETIEIYGDGNQTRDFTCVLDVVKANMLAMRKGKGVFNIASGNRISVNDLVEVIGKAKGTEPKVNHVGIQQGDVSHTSADITKAKNELGFTPKLSIDEGVKKHVEWFRGIRGLYTK